MTTTLGVPAHAQNAWLELHEQITRRGGTPCAGPDRNDWTGTPRQQTRAADACLDCPVLTACATYAAIAGETSGVWGGLTAQQRTQRRKDTA